MITNIQEGNIYKRIITNIQTGQKMALTYEVVNLNMAEEGVVESLTIRDAVTDCVSQISLDMAMIQSVSITLSRILLFFLGFEQRFGVIQGVNANSYFELILPTDTIKLVEEGPQYALVVFNQGNNTYQVATRLSTLDALQNYLYLHNHFKYNPNVNNVNHALLYEDDVKRWTMLVKERLENVGPLLYKGVVNYMRSMDNKCFENDVNVVLKYGISCNYFAEAESLSFDGILYTAI